MSPNSKLLLSLTLAILFILLPSSSADIKLITDTCNKLTKLEPLIGTTQNCVKFFQSDPRSETSTLEKLAEISFELAGKRIVAAEPNVKALAESGKYDDVATSLLEQCEKMYSKAQSSMENALKAFKAKDYNSANVGTSAASNAPMDCEDGFADSGEKSPLTQVNNEVSHVCMIPLVFTSLFQ